MPQASEAPSISFGHTRRGARSPPGTHTHFHLHTLTLSHRLPPYPCDLTTPSLLLSQVRVVAGSTFLILPSGTG